MKVGLVRGEKTRGQDVECRGILGRGRNERNME